MAAQNLTFRDNNLLPRRGAERRFIMNNASITPVAFKDRFIKAFLVWSPIVLIIFNILGSLIIGHSFKPTTHNALLASLIAYMLYYILYLVFSGSLQKYLLWGHEDNSGQNHSDETSATNNSSIHQINLVDIVSLLAIHWIGCCLLSVVFPL